jgi:AcrR family transcriptional regulator
VFVEHGIDAPLNLITKRAKVGKGTLYRHFEDRDAVIQGLSDRMLDRYEQIAVEADAAPTGWDGLVHSITQVSDMYFSLPWAVVARARARRVMETGGEAESQFRRMLERAWNEGSLRKDAAYTDLVFITSALGGLADLPEPVRSRVAPRLRDLLIDGLRAEGSRRPPLPGEPLDYERFRTYLAQRTGADAGTEGQRA